MGNGPSEEDVMEKLSNIFISIDYVRKKGDLFVGEKKNIATWFQDFPIVCQADSSRSDVCVPIYCQKKEKNLIQMDSMTPPLYFDLNWLHN